MSSCTPFAILEIPPSISLDEEQFFDLCATNRNVRLERDTKTGEVLIMVPTGWESSERNSEFIVQLGNWSKRDGTGKISDSNGGYAIAGASRNPMTPDAAWISLTRLNTVPQEQRAKFLPICPDFVMELRSPSDNLKPLQEKMEEWIELGARLGWLIDPTTCTVYVYQPGQPTKRLDNATSVSGDRVLKGFVLDLTAIW
ncbi:Uma2 family endonuclease [Lusitaniella coriacea LEGE 07157]|uniref:Uma2 family endonuclease n=1 Tax=Lusitaniella coriacea LEGE 07157 TaxID=945747 RepID=A0A8J7B2Z8_9CYAN|nr:Uma2 family endonuclease [Lusitaniella coriacea]MBE9114692.1 Uma2 family endonuclease [Lusitaniella coriacea LEGE 07157]